MANHQFLRVVMKEYNGTMSQLDILPYAIWHNQKTGMVTLHTSDGYYKVPADAIDRIEMLQTTFPFPSNGNCLEVD